MRAVPGYKTFPLLPKIPRHLNTGIGRVIVAQSRLHWHVGELVYDLLRVDYSMGRLSVKQNKTSELFGFARDLFDLWDIEPVVSLTAVKKTIIACEDERNALAHGGWIEFKPGEVRLVRTKGQRDGEWHDLKRLLLPSSTHLPKG